MPLELKDLPYSHDALESNGMSKETLEFHHDEIQVFLYSFHLTQVRHVNKEGLSILKAFISP